MTLTPLDARLILALTGDADGAIRPGDMTGLQALDIKTRLRECANMKDGEE